MTKITHLFKTYFPNTQGGLEEAIRQIGKYSVKNGFDVEVISVSKHPFVGDLDGVHCKSYYHTIGNDSMPFSIDLMKNFKNIVANTDILHLQFPWPTGELLTLLYNVKKPIVVTFHCDIHNRKIIRNLYAPFIEKVFKRAQFIIPTSKNLMDSSKILSRFQNKCVPINLWLDENRFLNLNEPSDEFKSKVENVKDYSLFIGVLRWYKGLEIIVNAAKSIHGNIVIVGKGPLFDQLKKQISDEKISNIYLMGFQPDENVKYLIKNCRFLILPSISPAEAFGQVLLEASYYSKPMITTELGTGTSYVNLDKKTGFVVIPGSSKELSEKSNILFDNNSLVQEFGQNAYHRYKTNFVEDIQGPKYLDIYNNLTKFY